MFPDSNSDSNYCPQTGVGGHVHLGFVGKNQGFVFEASV